MLMKYNFTQKHFYMIFAAVLLLQCLIIIGWGARKENYNIDELFTLEGSKQGGYGMLYWDLQDGFYGSEHTPAEFQDWFTTYPDELLIHQGTETIIDALLHREFYYVLVNLATTFYPGQMTYWIGTGLNMLLFILAQIVLYSIAHKIKGNLCALLTTGIYGFSAGAVSTVLFNRCYMLLTLLSLISVYLYLQFPELKQTQKKICSLLAFYFVFFISYRTHQFGFVLYGITTILFLGYYMIKGKRASALWIILGHGLPALFGIFFFYDKVIDLFAGGVADLFWDILSKSDLQDFIDRIYFVITTISKHLFSHLRYALILAFLFICLGFFKYAGNSKHFKTTIKQHFLWITLLLLPVLYYAVLVMGGAVGHVYSWKYLSPLYPVILLLTVLTFMTVIRNMKYAKMITASFILLFVSITGISYYEIHISELYQGDKALKEEVNHKFQGEDGILVQLDTSGEISLYMPALLWPDNCSVLTLYHSSFADEITHYTNSNDKILLWLTSDYEHGQIIDQLKTHTDYTNVVLAFSTPYAYVYECSK